jgi:hypothetical protein
VFLTDRVCSGLLILIITNKLITNVIKFKFSESNLSLEVSKVNNFDKIILT